MSSKLNLLVSVVVVLCVVGKASAAPVDYDWTNAGGNALWRNSANWLPSTGWPGENDGNDTADLEELDRGPIIDTGSTITVARIEGPDPCDTGVTTVDIETGATLTVKGNWTLDEHSTGTAIINISGNSIVWVGGEWRGLDDGTLQLNILKDGMDEPDIYVGGRLMGGNDDDANFVLYMDGGSFKAGELDLNEGGYSSCTILGGEMILNAGIEMVWGEFTLDGDANVAMNGVFSPREDADEEDPNSVVSLNSGSLFCTDFGPDGNDWSLDIEEGVTWIIKGERKEMLEAHIDAGRITGKDGAEPPVAVEYISDGSIWYPDPNYLKAGETYTQVGFDLVQENAYSPRPRRGSVDICPDSVTLSWTPGSLCVDDHNVYFGTSWDDVNESNTPDWQHYGSNSVTVTNLEVGKTYYWRVDEVNTAEVNSPWKGGVWHFTTEYGVVSDPSPHNVNGRGLKAEDVTSLSWSSHCIADAHNVYFATDLPEEDIVLFEDDFETGAFEPNWTATGSWVIFDANGDPPFGGSDANMARATGAGNLTITGNVDATEGDPCEMRISFRFRKTEEITDGEIKLYYGYGGNWDLIADLNSLPGTNDVWIGYSDTNSNSKYFVNDFKIALQATITSGGTVYIDDVTITNTWPLGWFEARVAGTSHPISVDPMTVYRWRVDAVVDGNVYKGPNWKFSTGYGGLVMYYKFDGTQGNDLPNPITADESYGTIQFNRYTAYDGTAKYGESNPVFAGSTASAEFDPCAALYRLDPCGPSEDTRDILRLDGSFTVEMWVMPRNLTEEEDVYVISKRGSWGLMIKTEDNWEFRWQGGAGDSGSDSVENDTWYHVAVVYDQTDEDSSGFYLNGNRNGDAGGLLPPDNNNPVWIGARVLADGNLGDFFDGMIDEIRIHDIALIPCEFLLYEVGPEYASCPVPWYGAGEIDPCTVELMWTPGEGAVDHDIYLSSNYLDVVSGSPVETDYGPNSWTPTEFLPLRNGTVYYWRVDTYDNGGPPYEGEVWRFTTKYVVEDENLLLHYKLDEITGDDPIDASGHGHHGDIDGDAEWDPDGGKFDGCLIFDNNQCIEVPSEATSAITDTNKISIAVWLYGESVSGDNWVLQIGEGDYSVDVKVPDENGDVYWRAGDDSNDALVWNDATPEGWEGAWHFFVFIKDESADMMKIYFDGLEVESKGGTSDSLGNVAGQEFHIGAESDDDDDYVGKMDDIRVYNIVLSQTQIKELFKGGDLGVAWGPSPSNGQLDVLYDVNLAWMPGDYVNDVNGHDVYFGTNWQDISDVNSSNIGSYPNVDYNNVTDTNYDPGILELGETYFWRVDEVNDACDPNGWKGNIWQFTVAEYLIIDDMEDYGPGYPISSPIAEEYGWDSGMSGYGTSSALGLVTPTDYTWVLAHGGNQAMYYTYDSSSHPYYSEIVNSPHFELDPNDWTTAGVKMLTLWFHGDFDWDLPGTAVERMYVGLEDTSGAASYAEVAYGDGEGEEVNDIAIAEWQEWNIALSSFGSVDLEDVNALYIGFGDRDDPVEGGVGNVVFDDIRLYKPTCVWWKAKPEFDLNNDCIVDFGDVEIMADDWLEADVNVGEVTAPPDGNLVGWWEFDEGSGSDAYDSSGYDFNGVIETIENDVWWVDGPNDVNYALDFDGGRVRVPDAPELRPRHQVSVSAWIKYPDEDEQSDARVVVKGAEGKETYQLEVDNDDDLVFHVRDGNDDEYTKYEVKSPKAAIERGEWVHVAGTYDGNSLKVYVNGEFVAENNDANSNVIPFLSEDSNDLGIGKRADSDDNKFVGTIDDVRIYDRGLTAAEVAYLATDGTGIFSVSLQSIADLHKDPLGQGAINFKDLAKLGAAWFDEELWP